MPQYGWRTSYETPILALSASLISRFHPFSSLCAQNEKSHVTNGRFPQFYGFLNRHSEAPCDGSMAEIPAFPPFVTCDGWKSACSVREHQKAPIHR